MKAFWWLAVCVVVIISVQGCGKTRHNGGTINDITESVISGRIYYPVSGASMEHMTTESFEMEVIPEGTNLDLLIIGGGLQAIAILAQFRRYIIQLGKRFKIGIIEKRRTIGDGLPYSKKVVTDSHITNTFQSGIDITTTDDVRKSDFIKWLEETGGRKLKGDDTYVKRPSRNQVGDYLKARFRTFRKECNDIGYDISVWYHREAIAVDKGHKRDGGVEYTVNIKKVIEKNEEGSGANVQPEEDEEITAHDIFLATGHFPHNRMKEHVDGFYSSPWPASTLLNSINLTKTDDPEIDEVEEHIGELGASLSAIDATLTVVDPCGTFVEVMKGFWNKRIVNVEYRLNEKCRKFKITMYSRTGQLPQVRGYIPSKSQVRHVNESEILAITREPDNDNFLPVGAIFDIVKDSLVKEEENEPESKILITKAEGYNQIKDKGPLELFEHIEKTLYSSEELDGGQKLKEDIDRAENTIYRKKKKAIPLQTVLYYSLLFFNLYGKYYSAEDILEFKDKISSKLFKYALTIPLQNAWKMYALYQAGLLDFKILVDICTLVKRDDGMPGIQLVYKDKPTETGEGTQITHNHFIDTTGQVGDIQKDDSKLTKSLLDNGLIYPLYVRYKSSEEGKKFAEEVEKKKTGAENAAKNDKEEDSDDAVEEGIQEEIQVEPEIGSSTQAQGIPSMCFAKENIVINPYEKRLDANRKLQYYRKFEGITMDLKNYQALPKPEDGVDPKAVTADRGAIYASGPYVYGYYLIAQSLYISVYIAELAVQDILYRHKIIDEIATSETQKAGVTVMR